MRRTRTDSAGAHDGPDPEDTGGRRGPGRRGPGPGPGLGHGFGHGFGPAFGPGPGRGLGRPGRRGRPRGDIRAAVLLLLEEAPRHGYQLIQDIAERSGGQWSPSAGSVYPTLQALEDEGLLVVEPVDGRKTASLTDAGRAHLEEHRERFGTPWQQPEGADARGQHALREAVSSVVEATRQVARVGTPDQQRRAVAALVQARTALYGALAEPDDAG